MKHLVLMRHAHTVWSAEGRMAGRNDISLTAEGREQALQAGRQMQGLPVAKVWTSPLERARQTAELLATGHGELPAFVVADGLTEVDLGRLDGHSASSARAAGLEADLRATQALDAARAAPGGEELPAAAARAEAVVSGDWTGVRLAVSHGILLRCLAAECLGIGAARYRRLVLDPCHALVLAGRDWNVMRLTAANVPPAALREVIG